MLNLSEYKIKYDANGLIPAIVQDENTRQVLMLAYMNAETLQLTLETGETHFWSRSRKEIWHKGATSGNIQKVTVVPAGPACHTGNTSCFFNSIKSEFMHGEKL